MKNLGYAGVALSALLYGSDVCGHYTLNVLEQINAAFKTQPKNETEINDTEERWTAADKEAYKRDRSCVRFKIDSTTGALWLFYKRGLYVEDKDLQGKIIRIKNTPLGAKFANMMPGETEKYGNWKHRLFAIDNQNKIELWWTGDKEMNTVVVNNANLNVPFYIKADNVFFLGSNRFNKGVTIAATSAFSNLGNFFITSDCRIFTHHGTNFGLMAHEAPSDPNKITVGLDETDRMFYKMPLDYDQSIDSIAAILKSNGFTDFGTSKLDNVITEDINFNTYGNTMVNKFTQNGNHRNMSVMDFLPTDWLFPWFYRMYFYPCQEFGVTINDLSGTNLLSIMGGKIIGPNTYGDNNHNVSIKVSREIGEFESLVGRENEEDYYLEQYMHQLLQNAYGKPYDEAILPVLHWEEPARIEENKDIWKWYTVIQVPQAWSSCGVYMVGYQSSDNDWIVYHKDENAESVVPFSYAVDYYLTQKLKQEGKLPVVGQSSGQGGDQGGQDQLVEVQIEKEEEVEDNSPSDQGNQNEQNQPNNLSDNNNAQQGDVRLDSNTTMRYLNNVQRLAKQFDKKGGRILMPDATGLRNIANASNGK